MACGKLTSDSRSIVKLKATLALRDLAKDPTKVENFIDNILNSINKNSQYELNSFEEFSVLNDSIIEVITNTGKLDPNSKEQIKSNISGILSKRMGLNVINNEIPEPTVEPSTHEEDSNIKLTTVDLDDFYGSAFVVKEAMLNDFQHNLLTHSLINFEERRIISNNCDLNYEIQNMKSQYFNTLLKFLNVSDTRALFINNKIDTVYFARIMELAKQEFSKLDRDDLIYAFNNIHRVNREGVKYNEQLINAFNAYAVLSNFDKLVNKTLGKIISISKNGNDSVYSLTIKNALSKSWTTTEETDAMKELGQFSRLLIETCPLIDKAHVKLGYVNMSAFLGVSAKLRNESLLSKLRKSPELYKLFINFHTAPSYYLPKIIEAVLKGKLNDYITFSRTDLNVLNSIYERFYNPSGNSLYNVMLEVYSKDSRTSFDILESIAEIVDRSCGNYYIQYVRSEDGVKIKEVTRINKDRESIRKQNAINIYNQYRTDKETIIEKYHIAESKSGEISAVIPLDNGESFRVSVKNGTVTVPSFMSGFTPDFSKLTNYYDKGNSVVFDETESKYIKLLEFIDAFLDTRFLTGNIQVLNKLVDNEIDYIDSKKADRKIHLNSLIQTALTAGNAIRLQLEYNKLDDVDLATFLKGKSSYYKSKLIKDSYGYIDGKVILTVDATSNKKLAGLINAEQELLGTPYKTTSKNLEGNNIPLNGISNLASYFTYFVNKVINSPAYANTAFGGDAISSLNGVIAKNGGENRYGTTKSISQFSVAELAYTSIIYDYFHNRFGENPEVLIQPTTYSDKSKIFLFKVLLNHLKNKDGVKFTDMTISQLKEYKRDTIKSFYKAVESQILSDYKQVFGDGDIYKTVLLRLDNSSDLENKPIDDYTMDDFARLLSVTEYWEYADWAWDAGVDNIENVHVCKNKNNNYLKPNNDLRFKAEILYDDDEVFNKRDLEERKKFLTDLINNNVNFHIKLKGGEDNKDLTYILRSGNLNVDIASDTEWNNKYTQELILAKNSREEQIKSVDQITDDFVLNPMLERYFYEYSTLAENIRLLLTGSEIAHPFKSNSNYPINFESFDSFVEEESTRAKAQLKRNVIVPATLLHFAQNSFMGIPSKYRIAVMEDFPANVYTFKGDSTSIDSMDGSALVHPVMAILENFSLQDNAVGLNKKPIGHGINSKYGNGQLLKFATFGIDNEWIRKSNLSTIKFKQLLGRMNYDWLEDIDLTKNIYGRPIKVTDMTGGERLYFNKLGKHYEVGEIYKVNGKENTYNINYYEVNDSGNRISDIAIEQKQNIVITNLTSLWEALGGEYSESLNNGELVFSNASWFAVANYVNWVGKFNGNSNELPNQTNTYQPLKNTMIAYLCNKSAIKVGATNINRKTSWTDNSPLRFFDMDTDGLGVQMDADHHADMAEMTEFTQVISSLEANGYLHDISKLTYEDLGKATLSIIKDEVKAVELYLNTYNKSNMYELIGRDLIKNIRNSDNKIGLSQSIIDIIKEEFKRVQKSHVNDEFKIPFSDSNIQAISLSTFTSRLNNTAVKKKHPGSGMVMVPGFGTIQNFWLDGKCYSYDDIYRLASLEGKTPEEYLLNEQTKIEELPPLSIDQLLPGDKIVVFNDNGERQELNIDTIEEYQRVKRMYSKFYPDVTKGQDLKPAQVYWEAGNKKFNLFDMPAVIHAIQVRSVGKVDKATDLELQKNIQNTFLLLDKGFMPLTEDMQTLLKENPEEFKSIYGDISYLNGVNVVKIQNLVNKPAELVVSKLYATKFHLNPNDTIASIKEEGINYFIKKYNNSHILATDQYDIAFTKGDGIHTYIVFDREPVGGIKIEDNDNIKRTETTVWRTDDKGNKLYTLSVNGVPVVEEFDVNGIKVLKTNKPDFISQIYKSNSFDAIVYGEQFNSETNEIINKFIENNRDNNYISNIKNLSGLKLKEFNEKRKSSLCRKQYVSFLKSLEFTASRIPAQTLQSFMKMEVKQFMSTDKNIAIVTPFQAYLQGSDYSVKCGIR